MSEEYYRKIFCERLNYYMNKQGIKQVDLAKRFNLAKSTVSSWCTGAKIPRMDKIETLANFLDVKKSDLLEDKHSNNDSIELTSQEIDFIKCFRKLANSGKEKVIDYTELVYNSEQKEDNN